ncbi:MAG: 50S ribosomal protein L11 methyltransferase [Chloroflexi bacterium]|nr:50S ribosomal protein L11 methyltransferase [Chloroflexota bacterium]
MRSAAAEPIRWIEIAVPSHPEAVEAVSEILSRVGYNGIAVDVPLDAAQPHVVKAYVVYDHAARIKVRRVKEAIGRLQAFGLGPVGDVALRRIADEDWLESWKAQFTPIGIGPFFVRPSWSSARAMGIEIVLDPGMAFGTGLHPTTRQCLEALGEIDARGRSVLDLGTGSGILAIGAAKRGATRVVAVDVDPLSVRAATENARLNNVAVEVREGSAADVGGTFDVVLANLVADVLVAIAADLAARLALGGTLVCAGIVAEKAQQVGDALASFGLTVTGRDDREDWVRLAFTAPAAR